MERYILGIDIGTTSVKALLISESGALAAEGKADHDLISAHPGWAEETRRSGGPMPSLLSDRLRTRIRTWQKTLFPPVSAAWFRRWC